MLQGIRDIGKKVGREVVSIPTKSTFLQDGKLTPDEFTQAGDRLCHLCPNWKWMPAPKERQSNFLNPQKQYLITKKIPCQFRAAAVTKAGKESVISGSDGDDWLVSDQAAPPPGAKPKAAAAAAAAPADDDDGGMFDFSGGGDSDEAKGPGVRLYDASITYDIYYNSPRLWLSGYDEDGTTILTKEQIFEDMSEDHAKKTATVDPHPYTGLPTASIHPCKHAETMKSMIDRQAESGETLKVDKYFFIFMKFVSSIVPTLDLEATITSES